jgi:signal transduction histidine kinase
MLKKLLFLLVTFLFFIQTLQGATTRELLLGNYIYNFAKYTQWPKENEQIHIHVISRQKSFFLTLKNLLENKQLNNHYITLSQSDYLDIPKNSDMIYIDNSSKQYYKEIYNKYKGKPVLLVTQEHNDKRSVMINIYETNEQNMRFQINSANILNQNLKIDPKIILLGGTELDVAKLYKGAQETLVQKDAALEEASSLTSKLQERIKKRTQELKQTQKILEVGQEKVKMLKAEIEQSNTKATTLKNELLTLQSDLERQKVEFTQQEEKLEKQHKEFISQKKRIAAQNSSIKTQEEELKFIKNDLLKMQHDFKSANQALQNMTFTLDDKTAQIGKKEQRLLSLSQKISQKTAALKSLQEAKIQQATQIVEQEETIASQKLTLFVLTAFIILFLFLVFTIYRNLKREHKTSLNLKLKTEELSSTLQELEKTQTELVEAEKMASLGGLVAGVAHELNTPLGLSITGVTQIESNSRDIKILFDKKELKASNLKHYIDTTAELANVIHLSLNKGAELIKSFKQVAVDQEIEDKREFYLHEYIETLLISFNSKFKHRNIIIHNSIDEHIVLNSYPGVYYQIISNFINNSLLHAFNEDDSGMISLTAFVETENLYLTYSDDGQGVDEEIINKIFDPFFTTKRANGGTGLGLHIIYNLVTQKLKGKILASINDQKGLQIDIVIPLEEK